MPRRSRRCSGAITAASASIRRATAARRSGLASCSAWTAAARPHFLWSGEVGGGRYRWKEVRVAIPAGKVKARAFAVDRNQVGYAGRLSPEATARLILQGIGGRGSCRQYLENTVCELRKLGLVDGPLHRLEQIVNAMAAREGPRG